MMGIKKVTSKSAKKPTKMRSLTIDRSKWGRGALLREYDGKMCCLGFVGRSCGILDRDMLGEGWLSSSPSLERAARRRGLGWLFKADSSESARDNESRLIDINDGTGSNREAHIAKIFADHGVKVTFVDGDQQSPKAKSGVKRKKEMSAER